MQRMTQPRPSFPEQLHSLLVEEWGINIRDFAHDSVARAMAALNKAREPLSPLFGQVLWLGVPIAFTAPSAGRLIS